MPPTRTQPVSVKATMAPASGRPARGIALVVLAAMLWGTTGTAQTFAAGVLSPYWVGALRLLVATCFFAVWLASFRGPARVRRELHGLDWPRAILAGVCMAGYNLAFFAGVKTAGVAVGTAVALGSAPIWAGCLQLAAGRTPSAGWWLGTTLAVAGGVLLLMHPGDALRFTITGVVPCLVAGFSYALYATLNRELVQRSDPGVVTLAVFAFAALLALPAAAWLAGPLRLVAGDWLVAGFLGVVATGVAYLLFSTGLRTVSAAGGVSLALVEPLTAFALAVLVVGEQPAASAYAGIAVLLVGLVMVVRAETRSGLAA